jgi:hypothetical protein
MLPLSLLAQRFFRRSSDSDSYFDQKAHAAAAVTVATTRGDCDDGELPTPDVMNGTTATLALVMEANGETNV